MTEELTDDQIRGYVITITESLETIANVIETMLETNQKMIDAIHRLSDLYAKENT